MKKILLLFIWCFSGVSAEGQQSLQLEVNEVWNSDAPTKSRALTWYFVDGASSGYALRMGHLSSEEELDHRTENMDLVQLDMVKRWHTSRVKKVTMYGDFGITGMLMNEKYNNYFGCCSFSCDCLIAVPTNQPKNVRGQQYGGFDYTYKDQSYALFFLPGATAGGGIDINLTTHFYLGLQCRMNAYYWAGRKKGLSYVHAGLSAGFKFN